MMQVFERDARRVRVENLRDFFSDSPARSHKKAYDYHDNVQGI